MGRGRYQTDVVIGVGVLPEQGSVETLLGQPKDDLILLLLELQLGIVSLQLEDLPHVLVLVRLPLVQTVDLVESNHERCFLLL